MTFPYFLSEITWMMFPWKQKPESPGLYIMGVIREDFNDFPVYGIL